MASREQKINGIKTGVYSNRQQTIRALSCSDICNSSYLQYLQVRTQAVFSQIKKQIVLLKKTLLLFLSFFGCGSFKLIVIPIFIVQLLCRLLLGIDILLDSIKLRLKVVQVNAFAWRLCFFLRWCSKFVSLPHFSLQVLI